MSSAFNIPAGWREVVKSLVRHIEVNECQHEDTYRGGAIWTICRDCDRKWADGRGGFKPYVRPAVLLAADKLLSAAPTPPVDAVPGEPVVLDGCELCNGRRGGVPGNENVIDGKRVCDYCHSASVASRAGSETVATKWYELNPPTLELGRTYLTRDGRSVKMVEIANAGKEYESMADEVGHHRYSRSHGRIIGRCTGSANDDPGNIVFEAPSVAPAAAAEPSERAASLVAGEPEPMLSDWPIGRAVDMLTAYAELVKATGRYAEEHYIPEVEQVISELREVDRASAGEAQS